MKANLNSLNRERAGTQINPKPYKMSKNLILEDDEDLVDETDQKLKEKSGKADEDEDYSDDFD